MRKLFPVYLLAIPVLLAACFTPTPEPTREAPDPETVVVKPPTYTPVPTYTPPPTYTAVPTYTPPPTYTPEPTFTPLVPEVPTGTPVSPVELSELEQAMFEAINAERVNEGLPALELDPVLTDLARGHAQDMVDRNYTGQITPDGKSYDDRLKEQGIEVDLSGEIWYAENCPEDEFVECAMNWFMVDELHLEHILHDGYRRAGIGIVKGERDVYYVVQDFAEDW